MINITPISALSDNYIWIIQQNGQAIIIDPSESEPVLQFLKQNKLTLSAILLTHHHHDHIGGIDGLLAHFPKTPIYCHSQHIMHDNVKAVNGGDTIKLIKLLDKLDKLDKEIIVFDTFGHTHTHLSYALLDNGKAHIFCGDTLFKAGCGRVFTGTIHELFESFKLFNNLDNYFNLLDKNIHFYPAHEYTLSNLKFAEYIEPNNHYIKQMIILDNQLRAEKQPTLPTNLFIERQINPFISALNLSKSSKSSESNELFNRVNQLGFKGENHSFEIFKFLRELKNTFQ